MNCLTQKSTAEVKSSRWQRLTFAVFKYSIIFQRDRWLAWDNFFARPNWRKRWYDDNLVQFKLSTWMVKWKKTVKQKILLGDRTKQSIKTHRAIMIVNEKIRISLLFDRKSPKKKRTRKATNKTKKKNA